MGNRHRDWFRQAEADLTHARNALASGDFEWLRRVREISPAWYRTITSGIDV